MAELAGPLGWAGLSVLMMSGDDVLMMSAPPRIEVFTGTGRRWRWDAEQKALIVEYSYATSVGEASARHGVSKAQLFNWRRAARDSQNLEFARVELDEAADPGLGAGLGVIEVTVGGGQVRLGPGADRRMALAIIVALKAGR